MICYLIGVIIILITNFGFAAAQQTEHKAGFSKLTLEISSNSGEFRPLEPIPINIRFSNQTDQPIRGHWQFQFTSSLLQLFTLHNGQIKKIDDLSLIRVGGEFNPRMIQPGEQHVARELLMNHLDTLFDQPGDYQIYAILGDADGIEPLTSNSLAIRILPAQGVDRQAQEYLQSLHNGSLIASFYSHYGFYSKDEELAILEDFVAKFKASHYWNYVAFMLAESYFYQPDEASYQQAIGLFNILSADSHFAFADQALSYLVRVYVKVGDFEKAKQNLAILKALYPTSEYILVAEQEVLARQN